MIILNNILEMKKRFAWRSESKHVRNKKAYGVLFSGFPICK